MRDIPFNPAKRFSNGGFSLVELMVGIAISLIATIVIFQVFAVNESYKRATTGGSDALQSGGFSAYALSRLIGAGGAGWTSTPGRVNAVGCALRVYRGATQLFGQSTSPYRIATALPAPFDAAIDFRITLAPALIIAGADNDTPDIIMVMAGNHSAMGRHNIVSSQGVNSVTLADNAVVDINASQDAAGNPQHDLLLAVEQDPGAARGTDTTCDIAEADGVPATTTPFTISSPISLTGTNFSGPDRFTGTGTPNYYSKSLIISNLGPIPVGSVATPTPPAPGTGPQFVVLGVGNDGTTPNALLSLNLLTGYCPLAVAGTTCATGDTWVAQSLADNIVSIKAIYGVAANSADPNVSSWVLPTGTWAASTLSASRDDLLKIRAIRLSVIARNAQPEKAADTSSSGEVGFSPATFTLFGGTAASMTVTNPDRHYRYKVFDITIPLRNMVLMSQNS